MTEALTLPGIPAGIWQCRTRSDPAARYLADRHYSRGSRGSPWVGPPGRVLVLVTPCERAAWITHHPAHALDHLDAWRCSLFRNEGAGLSSTLVLEAMTLTLDRWADHLPADGWCTYVDARKVRSTNPGACFKAAGWELDRGWTGGPWARHLVRLRARLEPG